eukprot:2502770-Rhodomonas_salina.1
MTYAADLCAAAALGTSNGCWRWLGLVRFPFSGGPGSVYSSPSGSWYKKIWRHVTLIGAFLGPTEIYGTRAPGVVLLVLLVPAPAGIMIGLEIGLVVLLLGGVVPAGKES